MPLLSRTLHRAAPAVLLLALAAWTSVGIAAPSRPAAKELELKSAFLLNFAAFVDWPAAAFANDSSPLVVGIYGEDTLGRAADDIFADEKVRGRSLMLRRIPRGGSTLGCHILFISDSERAAWPRVFSEIKGPTLTVANGPNFIEAGGMVEFVMDRGRLRFRINRAIAEKAGLTLSSKLLRLAQNAAP